MKRLCPFLLFLAPLHLFAQQLTLKPDNIGEIIFAMTPEEKVDLVVGCGAGWGNPDAKYPGTAGWTAAIPRLGVPSIYFADGPQGVNVARYREYDTADYSCTFFLSGSSLASSWDSEAAWEIGHAIGYELKERGLDVILGPGINLHRNVLCGRNQEYYSEDPVISGKMAAAWIKGAQSNGIATSLKHFAVNNQETNRKENDSRVDVRTLRELYLRAFEIAVKEGRPKTVMGSYNYVNGVHACENPQLLDDLLREEWGWDGAVMSDWDGVVRPSDAIKATCDLIEPGTDADKKAIMNALSEGSLRMEELDRCVGHILGLVVSSPSYAGYASTNNIDREGHRSLLRRVAAESMVLLKNEDSVLPLAKGKLALYGCASYDLVPANMGVNGVNRGVYHVSLVQGLREAGFEVFQPVLREYTDYIAAEKERIMQAYPPMYRQFFRYESPKEIIPGEGSGEQKQSPQGAMTVDLGFSQGGTVLEMSLAKQAASNDAAVLTLSRATGEAFDRTVKEFYLTESEEELIDAVSSAYHAVGKPLIVLLNVPAPIETVSWRDKADAILLVGQPGERAGESIADALTGTVPPSGRLTDTWPVNYGDALSDAHFPSETGQDLRSLVTPRSDRDHTLVENIDFTEYIEGIYMGYRYFSTFRKEVAYPFGHGLSYTSFKYEDATVEASADHFTARLTVRNDGLAPGREVVQLYVSSPGKAVDRPIRELKGFAKTRVLQPGESQTVEIQVPPEYLAYYNEKESAWNVERGLYQFEWGRSVEQIVETVPVKIKQNRKWKTGKLLQKQSWQ